MLVSSIITRNNINSIRAVTRQAFSETVHGTSNLTRKPTIRCKIIFTDITFLTIIN